MDSFAIFKNEKKNDKAPDYNISAKIGEKYVNIGGCWIKDGAKGKFFSCKLSAPYQDKAGFKITGIAPNQEKAKEVVEEDSTIPF